MKTIQLKNRFSVCKIKEKLFLLIPCGKQRSIFREKAKRIMWKKEKPKKDENDIFSDTSVQLFKYLKKIS